MRNIAQCIFCARTQHLIPHEILQSRDDIIAYFTMNPPDMPETGHRKSSDLRVAFIAKAAQQNLFQPDPVWIFIGEFKERIGRTTDITIIRRSQQPSAPRTEEWIITIHGTNTPFLCPITLFGALLAATVARLESLSECRSPSAGRNPIGHIANKVMSGHEVQVGVF
jgi:hypothetical protein